MYHEGCSTKKIKIETRCFDEIALKNQLVQITCWKDICKWEITNCTPSSYSLITKPSYVFCKIEYCCSIIDLKERD